MLKYSDAWFRNQTPKGTDEEVNTHKAFIEEQLALEVSKIRGQYRDEPGFRRQLIQRLAERELNDEPTNFRSE